MIIRRLLIIFTCLIIGTSCTKDEAVTIKLQTAYPENIKHLGSVLKVSPT
ncbi:MAG: hypothetical protein ACQEP8_04580 [Chlamydiota bacterium]